VQILAMYICCMYDICSYDFQMDLLPLVLHLAKVILRQRLHSICKLPSVTSQIIVPNGLA